MNYAIPTAFLSILLLAACSSGSNSGDQATPLAAQAESENLILGLWDIVPVFDEDVESDGEIDLYAEYFEITDDSFIFYITDGMSNCYEADRLPLTHISDNAYMINLEGSELAEFSDENQAVVNYEVTDSTLFVSDESTTAEFARVINISSQDFNSCTF